MNDSLVDLFGHHVWATRTLIDACRPLSDAQLDTPAQAAFGTIRETFCHLINSDAGYYFGSLEGEQPDWAQSKELVGLDELATRTDELERMWNEFLAREEFDAKRELVLDDGTYRVHAGIVLAQVIHHGNLHREQICAMLTALGVEPPDLQPWAYADTTGLSTWSPAAQ